MLMHFRIKNFDRYVGLFVILALALTLVVLGFIARGQKWFEKTYSFKTVFNKASGLKAGTPVTISGMEIGNVKSLHLTPDSKVEITFSILKSYRDFLRRDSEATVAAALLGGKTIELSAGSPNQPLLPEGAHIVSQEPRELTDFLKDIDLKAPLKKVDQTLDNVQSLTEKLNSQQGALFSLLRNVEFLTAQLKNGEGNAGAILQDKKIHADITATLEAVRRSAANLEQTAQNASKVSGDLPKVMVEVDQRMQQVKGILEDVKKTTADLPQVMEKVQKAAADAPAITQNVKVITQDVKEMTGDVKRATPDVPELLETARGAVREADQFIEGLERHWLLEGAFDRPRRETPVAISQRESPYSQKGGVAR